MSSSGFKLRAGRVPGERIATTIETADSSGVTTIETVVMSVSASVVAGRTYRVRFAGEFGTTVAGDELNVYIKEDSTSGTQLQHNLVYLRTTSSNGNPHVMEAEFTAVSSGTKTFVLSIVRASGTGTARLEAFSTRPSYLYVDYIRG